MKNYIIPEIELVSITAKDVISTSSNYLKTDASDKCVTVSGFGWGTALGSTGDVGMQDGLNQ